MVADSSRLRLRVIGVIAVSLFVALTARLWFLQVISHREFSDQATSNFLVEVLDLAPRGQVYDRNGKLLVGNTAITVVSISRQKVDSAYRNRPTERLAMLTKLATEISRTGKLTKVAEIEAKLAGAQGELGDIAVASDVDPSLLVYFGERGDEFPGVSITQRAVRDYPYGGLASHVLGYVGRITDAELRSHADEKDKPYIEADEIGKTGVELTYESELRGTPGKRVFEVDRARRPIRERTDLRQAPKPGNSITLNLDIDLQGLVEEELVSALELARQQPRVNEEPEHTAPAGAAVILDPRDGSVLAMASYPTYDPAEFIGGLSVAKGKQYNDPANHFPLLNRAVQSGYAPGSTFKVITAYSAMEEGIFGSSLFPDIDTYVQDRDGSFKLPNCKEEAIGCVVYNAGKKALGDADLRRALTISSDTYFYRLGAAIWQYKAKDHAIQDGADKFGFGRLTGIDLPFESAGNLPDAAQFEARHAKNKNYRLWSTGDNVTLAVGQSELLTTPLQLADAYGTIANGGTRYLPSLARDVRDADGKVVRTFGARATGSVDLPDAIRRPLMDGLLGVTSSKEGTAYDAFHSDVGFDLGRWPIAGKTGTAQVIEGKADTAWFAAFGPSTSPSSSKYVMATVLEETGFGGRNAAPFVAKVFDRIFNGTVPKRLSQTDVDLCRRRLQAQAAQAQAQAAQPPAAPAPGTPATTKPAPTTTKAAPTTTKPGVGKAPIPDPVPSVTELCTP